MGKLAMDPRESTQVDAILRDELARGDRALSGVAPVISHMLQSSGAPLVSDSIVARLRGMLGDIARQLLEAGQGPSRREPVDPVAIDELADALVEQGSVLGHLYGLAMEGQMSDWLEQRASHDPVLSPLLQELIASDDPATAELAMTTLAAQSQFVQSQRRMELPLGTLPAELFLTIVELFEVSAPHIDPVAMTRAQVELRRGYDEGAGRPALLARLVSSMQVGAIAALDLDHAGLALFVSALSSQTRLPREVCIFACHERQSARLALSLRAAGLDEARIEQQFLALLGPTAALPEGIGSVSAERAMELLRDADPGLLHAGIAA